MNGRQQHFNSIEFRILYLTLGALKGFIFNFFQLKALANCRSTAKRVARSTQQWLEQQPLSVAIVSTEHTPTAVRFSYYTTFYT